MFPMVFSALFNREQRVGNRVLGERMNSCWYWNVLAVDTAPDFMALVVQYGASSGFEQLMVSKSHGEWIAVSPAARKLAWVCQPVCGTNSLQRPFVMRENDPAKMRFSYTITMSATARFRAVCLPLSKNMKIKIFGTVCCLFSWVWNLVCHNMGRA
jgi:hypothetical protein